MSRVYAEVEYLGLRLGGALAPSPRELRVIQAEYMHEAAVITYTYDASLQAQCRRGLPVRILYGRDRPTEFYGAVHHVVVDQRAAEQGTPRLMRVVCVGATDPLNVPAARKYQGIRVDALVSDVARGSGFSVLIERHPYAWPLLQQADISTWAFLVSCAKRIGYTLYARNTDIRCHSRAIRYAGALTFRDVGGVDATRLLNAVYSFEIVQSETLSTGARKRRRIAQGLNDHATLFTRVTSAPTDLSGRRAQLAQLDEYVRSSASNIAEAGALVAGEQELNRHHIRARATVSGQAHLYPAQAVRLTGINEDQDGYWYTLRAEHVITQTNYQVVLELGKDSLGDFGTTAPVVSYPGDTAGRAVVHDVISVRPASHTGPAEVTSRWSDVTQQWRSDAPIERRVYAPARPPAVLVGGTDVA